jgi:type I restriction enzyme M protein
LDCPTGTFQGAGVRTVVLFFTKGQPTSDIWYYQLDVKRNLGKTNPLNDSDLQEFVAFSKTRQFSELSWTINAKEVDQTFVDLTVKNPSRNNEVLHRSGQDLLDELEVLEQESIEILRSLRETM